jgi:hypothetical protein
MKQRILLLTVLVALLSGLCTCNADTEKTVTLLTTESQKKLEEFLAGKRLPFVDMHSASASGWQITGIDIEEGIMITRASLETADMFFILTAKATADGECEYVLTARSRDLRTK